MIPFGKGQLSSNLAPSYEQQKKPWTLSRSSTDGKILIFISYNKNQSREKLIHKVLSKMTELCYLFRNNTRINKQF